MSWKDCRCFPGSGLPNDVFILASAGQCQKNEEKIKDWASKEIQECKINSKISENEKGCWVHKAYSKDSALSVSRAKWCYKVKRNTNKQSINRSLNHQSIIFVNSDVEHLIIRNQMCTFAAFLFFDHIANGITCNVWRTIHFWPFLMNCNK